MLPLKQKLIKYLLREGVELRTDTKARGNLGLFSQNRIDIRRKLPDEQFIEVLLHEYAHLIHKKLEDDMPKTGGSLNVLFDTDDEKLLEKIKQELMYVTVHVDENALLLKFDSKKYAYRIKIKAYENLIKNEYPDFVKSKPFKEFEKYIRRSDARFLLKYDHVRILTPFLRREKIYSIDTMEKDFPDMPKSFNLYIKICSLTRKSRNIQKRKNKLKKYYERPAELFARFVQALYRHEEHVKEVAPCTYEIFTNLLERGYYCGLSNIIAFLEENRL